MRMVSSRKQSESNNNNKKTHWNQLKLILQLLCPVKRRSRRCFFSSSSVRGFPNRTDVGIRMPPSAPGWPDECHASTSRDRFRGPVFPLRLCVGCLVFVLDLRFVLEPAMTATKEEKGGKKPTQTEGVGRAPPHCCVQSWARVALKITSDSVSRENLEFPYCSHHPTHPRFPGRFTL